MEKLIKPLYYLAPQVWVEDFPAENGFAGTGNSLENPETDTEIDW